MSTETASASTTVTPVADPNRIITIKLKASEAYILRYIAAILGDTNTDKEERKSLIKHCGATPEDMTRIHHKIYGAEMGWDHNWNEQTLFFFTLQVQICRVKNSIKEAI